MRAGRYWVSRSSRNSLSKIFGRTSNKITRWPCHVTTPRSTSATRTPHPGTPLAELIAAATPAPSQRVLGQSAGVVSIADLKSELPELRWEGGMKSELAVPCFQAGVAAEQEVD